MPINSLNVGRDVVLDIVDPANGGVLGWTTITSFQARQKSRQLQSIAMDGTNNYAELPQGWDLSFQVDRSSPVVDNYFATLENNYFTGIPTVGAQVTETVSEVDGSTSQYRYENLTLKLADSGLKSGDNYIKMKIEGSASRRRQIS
jgi:hypothetical protein